MKMTRACLRQLQGDGTKDDVETRSKNDDDDLPYQDTNIADSLLRAFCSCCNEVLTHRQRTESRVLGC